MSAADRYARPAPRPVAQLTRPQVAARVAALRSALETLAGQSELDGGPAVPCLGAMKVALIDLENRLREMDRQALARTLVDALGIPGAERRLELAGEELDRVRKGVA